MSKKNPGKLWKGCAFSNSLGETVLLWWHAAIKAGNMAGKVLAAPQPHHPECHMAIFLRLYPWAINDLSRETFLSTYHSQVIGSLRAEVAGKLLLQGVNFIREAIVSLFCAWLRLQKAGMAWDVQGVNTALPEGRDCVARPFPRATCVVLMVWCAQALCREERVHTCTQVWGEAWQCVGEAGMPCAGGQHMPLVSDASQTPRARWICSVLAGCTLSRVICLGLMNGKKPGLSCYADQDAGTLKSRTNPLNAFGKSATGI